MNPIRQKKNRNIISMFVPDNDLNSFIACTKLLQLTSKYRTHCTYRAIVHSLSPALPSPLPKPWRLLR